MRDGPRLFAVVAVVAFALRLPFLDAGYGWDSDAWRVASAAAAMADTGRYAAPRLPGNPVHDVAMALLWSLGDWARSPFVLNGASALVSALGAGAFALAWRRAGGPDPALAGIAAASVPAVFVASVSTMDYAWGFAFVAAAIAAALHGRMTLAGIFGALALGTRLSSALVLPAVAAIGLLRGYDLVGRTWPRAGAFVRALGFVVLFLLAGLSFYLPLWIERGTGALTWYEHGHPSLAILGKKATVDLWGWPGFLAWLACAAIALVRMLRARRTPPRTVDPVPVVSAGVSATAAAGWLRLPYKAMYLVPMVPFVLLAHLGPFKGGVVGPRLLRLLLVALCISPWLLTVSARGDGFAVDPRGPILVDHADRRSELAYGARIAQAGRALPAGSAVVVQDWLPMLRLLLDDVHGPLEKDGVLYTHLLDRASLDELLRARRTLYYVPGVDDANRAYYGVDLAAAGAQPLF